MSKILSSFKEAQEIVKKGGVIVAPTDTLYGLLTDALNKKAVEKVYQIKKRDPSKPVIVLIPSVDYLNLFNIRPSKQEKKLLENKGITVVIQLPDKNKFEYLHRGTGSIAFRIPDYEKLLDFLKETGVPVVAPSANPEGKPPAESIEKAVQYFGNTVDAYINADFSPSGKPSTIVRVRNSNIQILREGSIKKDDVEKIIKKV
ncbi:L-threonylcarbamoyladenylate synthase [Persephonella sp.]